MRFLLLAAAVLIGAAGSIPVTSWAAGADAPVLRDIQGRGVVRCSVEITPGFAAHDAAGRPTGFMVDLCRALAAAVLGDANAVDIRRSSRPQEFLALENGELDVSFAQTSWTVRRDTEFQVDFGPVVFHDGQGFATWRTAGANPFEAANASVCVAEATTAQNNLQDYLAKTGRGWQVRTYRTLADGFQAFLGHECTILSVDRSLLITMLRALNGPIEDVVIAPEVISHEPIAPLVSNRDRSWLTVVRWTMFVLFLADQKSIDSGNVAQLRDNPPDSEVARLLTGIPEVRAALGMNEDWAFQVIRQVGNYGQIFERNLGKQSPFGMQRGPNRPWNQGGLLYAPPFQ